MLYYSFIQSAFMFFFILTACTYNKPFFALYVWLYEILHTIIMLYGYLSVFFVIQDSNIRSIKLVFFSFPEGN